MKPHLTWLSGLRITEVVRTDFTWSFVLDDGSAISTESAWRLLSSSEILVTSEDDGHIFGLHVPVNAAERVTSAVANSAIGVVELRENTGDLLVKFSNGTFLEFLNLSCGYESWRTAHGPQQIISMGGGRLRELNANQLSE